MKKCLLLLCLLLSSVSGRAHDFGVDGICYNIISQDDLTVSVTYPNGGFTWYSEYTGNVTIPESVTYKGNTYRVTSIGSYAFSGCTGLTSVIIGNSVTSIGSYAFQGCSGLTSVDIGDGVTSIGSYAFQGCTGLTSVTIPNSVTEIGESAFSGCTGLTSVTIPNSVTEISYYAFKSCTGLTSVTIPNSVTKIRGSAFSGCTGLEQMRVEAGNTTYDSRENCNAIIETASNSLIAGCKNTVIPYSVTSIGNSAFEGCTGLTSVTIPKSVTKIYFEAFKSC
ncbi:MAG: leucine-rich repeat domain-containing protein, partial [Bacteroidaceae bacterium]|nr:leucine-rich repeat domain-containing protein [Bacteroidaceae bacterium]